MPVVEFRLHRAYEDATLIRRRVDAEYGLEEIAWEHNDVLRCLTKYSKVTLLHYYIFTNIAVADHRHYRKDIDEDAQIQDAIEQFNVYDIPIAPFTHSADDSNSYYDWFLQNEDAFKALWETVTDEVFHLLFRDRSFLLQFNSYVADYLASKSVLIPREAIAGNGFIKRDRYFPSWLRKAIFHRDQGMCVLCHCDLTGLFHTESKIHLDHMVPLASWGFNDPCNVQLLCQSCNLTKSGTTSETSTKYVPFWAD